jgi:hypothetical protein
MQKLTEMTPKNAPNIVLECLRQLAIETKDIRYWTASTVSGATGLPYKQVQIILNRFWADGLLERHANGIGVKKFRLKN